MMIFYKAEGEIALDYIDAGCPGFPESNEYVDRLMELDYDVVEAVEFLTQVMIDDDEGKQLIIWED